MNLQINNSAVDVTWCYFGLVFAAGIVIRFILSGLREVELRFPPPNDVDQLPAATLPPEWWWSWWLGFWSVHKSALVRDYWLPFFLGLFELAAYPYFIATGNWKVIGGWLLLKTAASWGMWTKSRSHYQRFLLGNAMVIAASVFLTLYLPVQLQSHQ